jgi:hypothetical protein
VRDLAITAHVVPQFHDGFSEDPDAEPYRSFAAVEQLEELVALFTDKEPSESDENPHKRHTLRHLAVETSSDDGTYEQANWQIIAQEPSAAGDDAFARRNWPLGSLHLRLHDRHPWPSCRLPRKALLERIEPHEIGKLWKPLRRLHGVRKVELAGLLSDDLAFELKQSIMSMGSSQ